MTIGAVAVIGGGIGGMQSGLDLAEAGFKVYLIENSPAIGGTMARLDKTFPTNDCAMCVMSPKLVECARHLNIEIISYAEIEDVKGSPGDFKLRVRRKPRYVDIEKCTGCDECTRKCPIEVPNEFDLYMSKRKAIYRLYPQAVPNAFTIEKRGTSPCRDTCPLGQRAQGYLAFIAQGKYKEALEVIKKDNPFPSICGRVCHHPCEDKCLRNEVDEPIAIAALKRFVTDMEGEVEEKPEILESREEEIAIIGSGPCGLTAARNLTILGYKVTVFESLPVAGGMLSVGILNYRLPKELIKREIESIVKLGVEIKTNTPIVIDSIENLKREGFKVVFIATGAHKSKQLKIPGVDLEGVLDGVSFLREFNLGNKVKVGDKVLVVGGGNVAIDVARTARRMGAKEVGVVCLEKREEMPGFKWEINAAEEEGVKLHCSLGPKEILGEKGKVIGLKTIVCKSVFDSEGRFSPSFKEGTESVVFADTIIVSIGQESEISLEVDPVTLETNLKGVFAGGDVVSGPGSVVEAIAAGKEAAISIDRYLKGEDLRKDRIVERPSVVKKEQVITKDIERKTREKMPKLPLDKRLKGFDEVELGFSEEMARREASRCLLCGICSECGQCEVVCEPHAIDHNMKETVEESNVGAVILGSGFSLFDARARGEYGFGRYPNVITSLQFERLLSSSGPTEGEILRPSDNKVPHRIAFIQCVGSRDIQCGNEYCSSVCCMYSTKEAVIAKEHHREIETAIFFIDIRAFGKDFDRYYENAKARYGVRYVRSQISKVYQLQQTKNLILRYVSEEGRIKEEEFDLVVLAVGMVPAKRQLGIELDEYGFAKTKEFSLTETSKPGIFAGGTFTEPKDIPEVVAGGSAAGAYVSELLGDSRWTLTRKKEYPLERDVSSEDLRIGVIICRCGRNIASVVDVPSVAEFAGKLPDVVYADEFLYSCSQDSLIKIKEKIKEYNLNRVVVASCTPRTHDPLFRDTIREAGLNPCLFDMASIREHCSWVHMDMPKEATQKAKSLVAMAVSKVRLLYPVKRAYFDVTKKVLVVGGGISGMTAALSVAKQGFGVYLIEREKELGGRLPNIYFTVDGPDPQALLKKTIEEVKNNQLIDIYCEARVKEVSGFLGNFKTIITTKEGDIELEHGTIIVAAGADEHEPKEYLYGKDPKILLQSQFEERLFQKDDVLKSAKSVVIIQCVESREEKRPYCSRVCCSESIKNALRFKELNPGAGVFILYRDIRTYGLMERYYKEAREKGIIFINYDKELKPRVELKKDRIEITLNDPMMRKSVNLSPELLVLSTGMNPIENKDLSKILKVPLNEDNFFMEAHAKIRPLDFTTEGIFLCGTAHSPRHIPEAITQAKGAAMRAVTILAKDRLEGRSEIVRVNERICRACGVCITVCPYDAREIDEETKTAKVLEAVCQGCGACAVACPSGATKHIMFEKSQIMAMVEDAINV